MELEIRTVSSEISYDLNLSGHVVFIRNLALALHLKITRNLCHERVRDIQVFNF